MSFHTHTHTHTHSFFFSPTHTHKHTLTHIHTHSLSPSLLPAHTHTHMLSPSLSHWFSIPLHWKLVANGLWQDVREKKCVYCWPAGQVHKNTENIFKCVFLPAIPCPPPFLLETPCQWPYDPSGSASPKAWLAKLLGFHHNLLPSCRDAFAQGRWRIDIQKSHWWQELWLLPRSHCFVKVSSWSECWVALGV